jgi:hypothetical protein
MSASCCIQRSSMSLLGCCLSEIHSFFMLLLGLHGSFTSFFMIFESLLSKFSFKLLLNIKYFSKVSTLKKIKITLTWLFKISWTLYLPSDPPFSILDPHKLYMLEIWYHSNAM